MEEQIKAKILNLIKRRHQAKVYQDWDTADFIRNELRGLGIELSDIYVLNGYGTKWRFIRRD